MTTVASAVDPAIPGPEMSHMEVKPWTLGDPDHRENEGP